MIQTADTVKLPEALLNLPIEIKEPKMDFLYSIFDFFIHLDKHLFAFTASYGIWVYLLLFMIIFCETGLVVTPFLPGDSLLFVAGSLAATGALDIHFMVALLIVAAILGDTINYSIGRRLGMQLFKNPDSKIFKQIYLDKTHTFYERHGGKTVILARFAPIVRTFAPFVAGMGKMSYHKFFLFNVTGGILWVALFAYAGYLFGNISAVKSNLTLIIMMIVLISIAPGIYGYIKHRQANTS